MIRARERLVRAVARRRARRGQEGFVLAFVLGIIALTSLVIVALLGLALTSARIADQQAQLARETRAADGALEAAVDTVRAGAGDPCTALPTGQTPVAGFAGRGSTTLDVRVECLLTVPPSGPDADLAGPDVEIVGTTPYAGSVTAPSVSGVTDPTFVWSGIDDPLQFNADVRVNAGGAPVRASGGAAVDVAGQYRQRQVPGGGAGGCGPLGTAATPSNQIVDFSGVPTCDAGLAEVAPELATPSPPTVLSTSTPGLPSCGATTTVNPGRYSRALVEALNDVLGDGSTCSATVVFAPGIHVVDVYDAAGGKTGDARTVLDISNPNALVVGGVPVAGLSAASYPQACDTTADGVTFELSGRSAIRHTAGRVALCARRAGSATLPVLVQTGQVDAQPVLAAVPTGAGFANPQRLALDGDYSVASLNCPLIGPCESPSFSTVWSSPGTAALTTARLTLDQRQIPAPFGIPQAPWSYFEERVFVRLSVVGPGINCQTDAQRIGRSLGGAVSYDLLSGTCASALSSESSLDGATVSARFTRNETARGIGISLGAKDVRIELNGYRLDADTVSADAAWTNPQGVFGSGAATATQSPATANPPTAWEQFTNGPEGIRGQTYSMTLSGFDLPSGAQASDPVSALSVRMRSPESERNVVTDSADGTAVDFTLRTADGQECSTDDGLLQHRSHAQSDGELRYDLFLEGDCATKVATLGQVTGGTLQATIRTGCVGESQLDGSLVRPVLEPGNPDRCRSVRVPVIDDLGLVVRTNVVRDRPPSSTITVDTAIAGNADPASFDVFGPVLLPRTDLDVIWRGEHYARPLIGDRLQVHGLGSAQSDAASVVGVVCCNPFEGVGFLQATIDGVPRAQAVVEVDTTAAGTLTTPRPVTILDWKLCGRGGCAASP